MLIRPCAANNAMNVMNNPRQTTLLKQLTLAHYQNTLWSTNNHDNLELIHYVLPS